MNASPNAPVSAPALVITHDELLALVAAHVAAVLPPETIATLAADRIDARIGRLTLEEAMPRLGCSNIRQVKDKCRRLGIPIRTELGQKAPFLLIAEIEQANQTRTLQVAPIEHIGGTRIGAVHAPQDHPAALKIA